MLISNVQHFTEHISIPSNTFDINMSAFESYDFTIPDNDGILREDKNGVLCICICLYGNYKWEPLSELSGNSWMNYRSKIREGLERQRKRSQKNKRDLLQVRKMNETNQLFDALYEKLPIAEKRAFLNEHKNTWLGRATCTACLGRCNDKHKCLHSDCPGMCSNCAKNLESCTNCPACQKKQVITCPICQEDKKPHELARSATCSHSVCWKCYGLAFQAGHPIENCPLCRATFTQRANQSYFDDSSDGSDMEDEFDEFDDDDISQDIIHILEQEALPIPEGTQMDSINQAIISQQEISLILAASVNSDDERELRRQIELNLSNGTLSV